MLTALAILVAVAIPPAAGSVAAPPPRAGTWLTPSRAPGPGPCPRRRGRSGQPWHCPRTGRAPPPIRARRRQRGAAPPDPRTRRCGAGPEPAGRLPARLRRLPVRAVRRAGVPLPERMYALPASLAAPRPAHVGNHAVPPPLRPHRPGHADGDHEHPQHRDQGHGRGVGDQPRRTSPSAPGTCAAARCPARAGCRRSTAGRPPSARRSPAWTQLRPGDIIRVITGQGVSSYEVVAFGSSSRQVEDPHRTGCSC